MNIRADELITKCQRVIPDLGSRVENSDWYFFFTESIREMRANRTLPWQRRTTTMEFFTDIFEYALPADFDSPIKPHKDAFVATGGGPFLLYGRDKDFFANTNYGLAIKWERDVKTLLARQNSEASVLMDGFGDETTEYTTGGDINTLSTDSVYYKEGVSSLRFNITSATGSGTISRTIDSPIDMTSYLNKGYAFLWVYMPTVVNSVSLKYGNDSSNYYSITATTDVFGNAFQAGWNLIKLSMHDAAQTGTVTITAIDYYEITIAHTTVTDTDFRIDGLTFHIPSLMEMPYNSKNVVKDVANTYKESVTADTDTILCDETFESAIMYASIEKAAMFKIRDNDLVDTAKAEKKDALINLNRRYPSTEALVQSNYYSRFNQI